MSGNSGNADALPAVAFLLTLFVIGSFVLTTAVVIRVVDRDEAASSIDTAALEISAAELREQADTLRNEIDALREVRTRLNDGVDLAARLDKAKVELELLQAELETATANLATLETVKAELEDRLRQLQADDAYVIRATKRREEFETDIKLLKLDIAQLEREIETVRREIDEEQEGRIEVADLVPKGIKKTAAFVETNTDGALLMPDGEQLVPDASDAAKKVFLERAKAAKFVMFLIRPDGFDPFLKYRGVLEEHNRGADDGERIDFGYQPVDADWALTYPAN